MEKNKKNKTSSAGTNNSPELVVEKLAKATCCRGVIEPFAAENWLDQYIWRVGCNQDMAEEAKECIIYALMFILSELKSIPKEEMSSYILNPDKMLEEVISFGENRGWTLDKHSAVGLCAYIIDDYIYDTGELLCDSGANDSALEQIIKNYPENVITDICDPVWEIYYDDLIFQHCEDEDAVYQYHDVHELERAVKLRKCIPSNYYSM